MDAKISTLEPPVAEVDPDILELLRGASLSWLLPAEAYRLGVIDGQNQTIDATKASMIKGMRPFAEMFYNQLKKMIPDKGAIRQHRIGIDEKTGVPTSLTVIAAEYEKKLMDIMHMARNLELGLFQVHSLDYSFWVITERSLDQELIDLDFPCYRMNVDAD